MTKQGKDQTAVDQSHTSTQTILLQSHQLGHVILAVITQQTHTHTALAHTHANRQLTRARTANIPHAHTHARTPRARTHACMHARGLTQKRGKHTANTHRHTHTHTHTRARARAHTQ